MDAIVYDWGFTFSVVIVGIVVVAAVLMILVILCSLMGKVFATIDKNKNAKLENEPPIPTAISSGITSTIGSTGVIQMAQNGISNEVVAAISTAVSLMLEKDGVKTPFVLKSIKRSKNSRPLWNEASVRDNTSPF